MSLFENVTLFPPDPIFGLGSRFKEDPNPNKVDLTVGIFRNEQLETPLMECVRKGEALLHTVEKNKLYLPIEGEGAFIKGSQKLVFGQPFCQRHQAELLGIQTLGGTGGLRLGGEFLRSEVTKRIYLPDPTWPNHQGIFKGAQMEVATYPYYNQRTHTLEFERMCAALSQAPEKSAVLLHGCCHNPTGCDLTKSQWEVLSSLFIKKRLVPLFDFAYQGFGEGIETDAWAIRYFANQGQELVVATSHSKNFGLYGERVGCLSIVCKSKTHSKAVASQMKKVARTSYSNPPCHGARILAIIFNRPDLLSIWEEELEAMRHRITSIKNQFVNALKEAIKVEKFDFLKNRHGLFSLLGIDHKKVQMLLKRGIYLTENGRINLTGLNQNNLSYVIDGLTRAFM